MCNLIVDILLDIRKYIFCAIIRHGKLHLNQKLHKGNIKRNTRGGLDLAKCIYNSYFQFPFKAAAASAAIHKWLPALYMALHLYPIVYLMEKQLLHDARAHLSNIPHLLPYAVIISIKKKHCSDGFVLIFYLSIIKRLFRVTQFT